MLIQIPVTTQPGIQILLIHMQLKFWNFQLYDSYYPVYTCAKLFLNSEA